MHHGDRKRSTFFWIPRRKSIGLPSKDPIHFAGLQSGTAAKGRSHCGHPTFSLRFRPLGSSCSNQWRFTLDLHRFRGRNWLAIFRWAHVHRGQIGERRGRRLCTQQIQSVGQWSDRLQSSHSRHPFGPVQSPTMGQRLTTHFRYYHFSQWGQIYFTQDNR